MQMRFRKGGRGWSSNRTAIQSFNACVVIAYIGKKAHPFGQKIYMMSWYPLERYTSFRLQLLFLLWIDYDMINKISSQTYINYITLKSNNSDAHC